MQLSLPMTFQSRVWQQKCFERFQEVLRGGSKKFIFEACMGAGKSSMAALLARSLLDDYEVSHVLALVPWKSIQGDAEKGMWGTFASMNIDCRSELFTQGRRLPYQPLPDLEATVTLYWEACCQQAIETVRMWKDKGWTFALICDEIHHTNEINSSWGTYVQQLEALAEYSVFMSGTFFRTDKKPISCIPLDGNRLPVKDFSYPYRDGVADNVVRPVTTRDISADVKFCSRKTGEEYVVDLREITSKELSEAQGQVLDANGEWIGHLIEVVHADLMQSRSKFADAACLFVCRPGEDDSQEDRHVSIIAKRIEQITGYRPTVVTHRDTDALGKIRYFRKAKDPYLVAINMVSEGCDIPRLRSVAFCAYTESEMKFRQIAGRALRMHVPEDGTAAQIYIPAFPLLLDFARHLYTEAREGVEDRTCKICGQWPCVCPCPVCHQRPCICEKMPLPPREKELLGVEATPVLAGGHIGEDHVQEQYVSFATKLAQTNVAHRWSNPTQLGHVLQQFQAMSKTEFPVVGGGPVENNPAVLRERLRRQINRNAKRLAFSPLYQKDFARAYVEEIEKPFGEKFSVILNTWAVDNLKKVADRLQRRIVEVFKNGY